MSARRVAHCQPSIKGRVDPNRFSVYRYTNRNHISYVDVSISSVLNDTSSVIEYQVRASGTEQRQALFESGICMRLSDDCDLANHGTLDDPL
jgi:hypothetical protein